jgi:hypothetical protein
MTTASTPPADEPRRVSRRGLLRAGGLTVSLAAVLAACNKKPAPEPGRVGFAPVPTDLAKLDADDGVRLRTATSIEYTIIDLYGQIEKSGELKAEDKPLLDRLVQDHKDSAAKLVALTKQAGAEPYECVNQWYVDRVIPPIFTAINGDESTGVEPSDDPGRDWISTINAFESMAGAMYQGMAETLASPPLRGEVMAIGALSARHAAVSALRNNPPPDGYVSPVVLGREAPQGKEGLIILFAIPTEFGSLAPTQLAIGAPSSAGTRTTIPIDTPAENSFIYTGMTCPKT